MVNDKYSQKNRNPRDSDHLVSFNDNDFELIEFSQPSHPLQQHIMPVVAYNGTEHRMLGTCFTITTHGLVLTARHVIDEALQITNGSQNGPNDGWWVGALYVGGEHPDEEFDLVGGILPANKVYINPKLDMGILALSVPINKVTGKPIRLFSAVLDFSIPEQGQLCCGFGYHGMVSEPAVEIDYNFSFRYSLSGSKGSIQEIHFPIRDSVQLHFPCFQTTARFDGGMSGGPIIKMENGDSNIIGVVCSSFETPEDGDHITYGSLIGPALALNVSAQNSSGIEEPMFLYDFVEAGSVIAHNELAGIDVKRSGSEIFIDFGNGYTIRNTLSQ